MTQIFLLQGNTTFPDPGNWGLPNKIECVGCGGGGGAGMFGPPQGQNPGGGGGGGAYAHAENITPTFPVPVFVGAGAQSATQNSIYTTFGFSNNGNKPPTPTSGMVYAGNGAATNASSGNAGAGTDLYPAGFPGGIGGWGGGGQLPAGFGGGGAGAGGPNGAGANGIGTSGAPSIVGGSGDAGHTPAGAKGTQWDASHGIGGGGSGGTGTTPNTRGGQYGDGSGGGGGSASSNINGGDGLIVITYNPNSLHYGIVRGVTTKYIYMTVKPDVNAKDDKELDNPAWLQIGGTQGGEALQMLKIDRMTYNSWTSFSQLVAWAQAQP